MSCAGSTGNPRAQAHDRSPRTAAGRAAGPRASERAKRAARSIAAARRFSRFGMASSSSAASAAAVQHDELEIGDQAVWSLSTAKPGNGVEQLRDDNTDTYWQ